MSQQPENENLSEEPDPKFIQICKMEVSEVMDIETGAKSLALNYDQDAMTPWAAEGMLRYAIRSLTELTRHSGVEDD